MTNEELSIKLEKILSNQQSIGEDVVVLKEVMTGNGNPARGMIVRFALVESWVGGHKKFGTAMLLAAGTGLLSFVGSITLFIVKMNWS